MENYEFIEFKRSNAKNKKYAAILEHRETGRTKTVNFGDKRYQHFKDSALGLYSNLDHGDPERRKRYHARHSKIKNYNIKFTPAWFSRKYLW